MIEKVEISKEQIISFALDYLRFPLALIVILVHVLNIDDVGVDVSGCNVGMIEHGSIFDSVRYIINVFIRGISVPIYLFISGYVFFRGLNEYTLKTYKNKISNRIHSLLIPYFIWNSIELLLVIFIHLSSLKSYTAGCGTLNLSLRNIISCFWVYNGHLVDSGVVAVQSNALFPLNTPLWFLRDLFCVALITPIIYIILKKLGHWAIIILFGLCVLPIANAPLLDQFFSVLLFFSIGAYLAIHKVDLIKLFTRFYILSIFIYVVGSVISIVVENAIISSIFKNISILGALFLLYNLALKKVQSNGYRKTAFLAASSMFLYLSHSLICMRFYKVLLLIFNPNHNVEIVFCLLISYILVIAVLLISYYILRKYTPRIAAILTGRK